MSAEFEAQILADLRRTHAQLKLGRTAPDVKTWSMRLTIEEVDLLLKIVDERDDLKRRLLSDWEPDLPAGVSAGPATTAPPAGCPFADTIHDCPLGGCPDASPREVQIPDLPSEEDRRRITDGRALGFVQPDDPDGREARETPNAYPERNCRWCGTRIKPTPATGVFEHVASVSVVGLHPAEPVPTDAPA